MPDKDQPPDSPAAPIPDCPKCQGPMWDNRVGKKNPKAPDFKCKNRECDGVIWPPRAASTGRSTPATSATSATVATGGVAPGMPVCPVCGGPMWDDRSSKRNPRAPDFKCKNKPKERGGPGCEGVIWPPRDGSPSPYPASAPRRAAASGGRGGPPAAETPFPNEPPPFDDAPPHDDDDLPF
jgi:hypothetical protein